MIETILETHEIQKFLSLGWLSQIDDATRRTKKNRMLAPLPFNFVMRSAF